jgi:hypothetical protein
MECLRKTKDIRDELNMICRVLEDQDKVISDFTKSMQQAEPDLADMAQQNRGNENWNKLLIGMSLRRERVEKLDKEAGRVENWVYQIDFLCNKLADNTRSPNF